jgi:hypothetical protein
MQASRKAALILGLLSMHAIPALPAPEGDGVPSMLVEGDLLFEDVLSEQERDMLRNSVSRARANIVEAYGEQKAQATEVIWCKTKACAYYFGGPTMRSFAAGPGPNQHGGRYVFTRPAIVILRQARVSAAGNLRAVETITHEMSHFEFKARLNGAIVPAWFNEGVATYLGNEHRCSDDMKGVDKLSDLASSKAWMTYTNQGNELLVATYCQARNEVGRWLQSHGGFSAVVTLLAKRAHGDAFEALYGT